MPLLGGADASAWTSLCDLRALHRLKLTSVSADSPALVRLQDLHSKILRLSDENIESKLNLAQRAGGGMTRTGHAKADLQAYTGPG